MRSWALLAAALPAAFSRASVLGVDPSKAQLYAPIAGSNPPTWKCLNDSSRVIPFSAINDDYCDCPDGSDEPGTSACPGSSFYCHNVGHIGATISGASVNDGLCEPNCCDGSDEPEGVCPNVCKEVGKEYRTKMNALLKVRKTGAKIRGTYVAFAVKERVRLQESIEELKKDIVVKQKEFDRLEDILQRTESVSHAAMEHKKQSPLYQELLTHSRALKSLQGHYKRLQEKERTLANILSTLKDGYNPNYQDMAVLEAVRGWDAYHGEESSDDQVVPITDSESTETVDTQESDFSAEEIVDHANDLLAKDHENLLIQHDEHIAQLEEEDGSDSYIPDALVEKYESIRDTTVGWLTTLGVVKKRDTCDTKSAEATSAARQNRDNARSNLSEAERKLANDEEELGHLSDATRYGTDGAWRKLKETCLSKDTGEYTYEVCLFGNANQKSNNGGGSNFLGRWTSWNTAADVEVGSPAYYSVQMYTGGSRCWNGPERSVTLKIECGTENALLTVTEPEKCEYHITGTTPALCLPLSASEQQQHQEL